jgi:hypothetical protein
MLSYWFLRFYARSQSCEKQLVASSCLSVCLLVSLSVEMEQISSQWTNCHEISYLKIFRKSVEKLQVSLKFDKSNRYFA